MAVQNDDIEHPVVLPAQPREHARVLRGTVRRVTRPWAGLVLTDDSRRAVIDADHLAHQREWSTATFGPGPRTHGVLDHIRKELAEIEDDPTDLSEWVDVIILAFDGAWRAGWEPQDIIDAIKAKQARNEAREWPDWRTQPPDRAIEHVRTEADLSDRFDSTESET